MRLILMAMDIFVECDEMLKSKLEERNENV